MVCPVHGTPTRITCVTCGRPICPEDAQPSPVGLTCGEHGQRSIRLVRWSPARGPVRPLGNQGWLVFAAATLVLGFALRASVGFFTTMVPDRPWVGITVLGVILAALVSALLYWLRRGGNI